MSETYARGGYAAEETTAGGVILMAISFLAAVLVLAGLVYAAGTGERHKAALAAAGCEPNLSPSGCLQYPADADQPVQGIVTPASSS